MKADTQLETINDVLNQEPFEACDRLFVDFLRDSLGERNPIVLIASALCLAATREGHACVDLRTIEIPDSIVNARAIPLPSTEDWETIASNSSAIGFPTDQTPLVLDGKAFLYLRKYYEYESLLAQSVSDKAQEQIVDGPTEAKFSDLRQRAVAGALAHRLHIISGGPGTGKTTAVLDYLIQAMERWRSERTLRIAAAAPTGKAAIRLAESIRKGLDRFDLEDASRKTLLSIPCLTIHRLLEGLRFRTDFKRNQRNPLPYDILVVDESSMIDLPLMQRLFDAIPKTCSTVLLGDGNQLSSVEVGSIFSDLVQSATDPNSLLSNHSTTLRKTYRFSEDSAIYRLCEICKSADRDAFHRILHAPNDDFQFNPTKAADRENLEPIVSRIETAHTERLNCQSVEEALGALERFIALAPFNQGPFGSSAINRLVDARVRRSLQSESEEYYQGQPILVLENNYDLDLFNGDIGIVWTRPSSDELAAWFFEPSGKIKSVRLHWLPKHTNAFCLTIHKSQGSEFDEVLGIFGSDDNEFITRELVYTCASRARKRLELRGSEQALLNAIERSVHRASRLEQRILENNPANESS